VIAGHGTQSADDAYTQLAAAVLAQALRDVVSGDEEDSLAAFEFFFVREDDGVGSVGFWCGIVGWSPTRLRRALHTQHRGRIDWLAAGYAMRASAREQSAVACAGGT
jgi:hypothetical protein